jgi:DNA-binding NarL/FixJ family response regulator
MRASPARQAAPMYTPMHSGSRLPQSTTTHATNAPSIPLAPGFMVMEEGFACLDTYRVVHERWPHIACVIASGFSESDRAREARALGAEAFIKKPYTLDQLALAARKALDTP